MKFRTSPIAELTDDIVRSEVMIHAAESARSVDLPVDRRAWAQANEIRAEIYLPAGRFDSVPFEAIQCDLVLSTRSEGFDSNDGYWSSALVSPRAGNIWSLWRDLRFPAECFYTRGIPAGWHEIESAKITVPEGCRVRNVRLVRREIHPGPRMTDDALAAALDPTAPGFESIAKAGGTTATLEAAVACFRRRGVERATRKLRARAPSDREEAERVLSGRIMEHDWADGIDWTANPTGYIEWSIRIHFLWYLRALIAAYRETGESKYALGIERILADWIAKNPVPYGVRSCGLAWGHSLVVNYRAYDVLPEAFAVLCDCADTSDRIIIDTLKSIYEHAEYLIAFESMPPSNKTIAEGRSIGALGCTMSEFRDAPRWREYAYSRLLEDLRIQVFPDGASYELTPGYQLAIASWFLEAWDTARTYGYPVPEELERGIRAMYAWSTAIARPDFSRPSVSDASSLDGKYGKDLEDPGRWLDDPHALWVGTEGREGEKPPYDSIALRDSGYFVMRSGWERNSRYLLFEGGPYGRFHQHEDMLSFDLYADGTPFIVDPGITSYFPDRWTEWYRTTSAHNTILVEGRGQSRRTSQTPAEWGSSAREKTRWHADERSDVAVATYLGPYGDLPGEFTHRRIVLFVKPDYFVIFDEVDRVPLAAGAKRAPQKFTTEALFHFMPFKVLVDPDTRAVRTARIDESNLEVIPLADSTPELVCGRNDPVQGWVSIGKQDVPAPVASFRTQGAFPHRCGYLLVPFAADRVTAGVHVVVDRAKDVWTVTVATPTRRDKIGIDWNDPEGARLA
jgi:uncharacterized heparinase superfamily protein